MVLGDGGWLGLLRWLARAAALGSPAAKEALGAAMAVGLCGRRRTRRGWRLSDPIWQASSLLSRPTPTRRAARPSISGAETL